MHTQKYISLNSSDAQISKRKIALESSSVSRWVRRFSQAWSRDRILSRLDEDEFLSKHSRMEILYTYVIREYRFVVHKGNQLDRVGFVPSYYASIIRHIVPWSCFTLRDGSHRDYRTEIQNSSHLSLKDDSVNMLWYFEKHGRLWSLDVNSAEERIFQRYGCNLQIWIYGVPKGPIRTCMLR